RCLFVRIIFDYTLRATVGAGVGGKRGLALSVDTLWLGFPGQQLAQHELQNAAIRIVLRFLRSIDTNQAVELGRLTILSSANSHLAARSKFVDKLTNTADFEDLIAGQAMRLRIFSGEELQRDNSHAN